MAGHFTGADATAPASRGIAVTPSDATILPVFRALYIGTTGDVIIRMIDGNVITFTAVAVGILPVQGDQVRAATGAGAIVALY